MKKIVKQTKLKKKVYCRNKLHALMTHNTCKKVDYDVTTCECNFFY